ncbi:MAG: Ku protein [Deltaproteobacteria bacterium]|nr:Ku protein [Deltaproteobacteria bacterium]
MPESHEDLLRRRAFWSGTVTFGLVSVPVALLPGNRSGRVSLRMLAPDGTPLERRYVCPAEDRPVGPGEIVRGYEVEKGRFVVVSDEELDSLAPEKSREIDLRRFVPAGRISPFFFDRSYFLVPTGDARKPYRLLAETMERTGRAGVATFVMRSKEYLVAILARNGILRAVTLRFQDELRSPEEAGLPEPEEVSDSDLSAMEKAVRAASIKEIPKNDLEDADADRLLDLVRKKRKSGKDVIPLPEEAGEEKAGTGKVIDLMEILKRSMKEKGPSARSSGKKRAKKPSEDDLSGKTKKELYEQAKKLDIPGRSDMDKDALVQAIQEHG